MYIIFSVFFIIHEEGQWVIRSFLFHRFPEADRELITASDHFYLLSISTTTDVRQMRRVNHWVGVVVLCGLPAGSSLWVTGTWRGRWRNKRRRIVMGGVRWLLCVFEALISSSFSGLFFPLLPWINYVRIFYVNFFKVTCLFPSAFIYLVFYSCFSFFLVLTSALAYLFNLQDFFFLVYSNYIITFPSARQEESPRLTSPLAAGLPGTSHTRSLITRRAQEDKER